jgi:hypothetical protein
MAKKNNPLGAAIFIVFFMIFFLGPIITTISRLFLGSGMGGFVIIPIIFFIVFIVIVVSVVKGFSKAVKTYDANLPKQEVLIPVDFFKQGDPVSGTVHSDDLFKNRYGKKVLYYENGKPVYEHK